MLKEIRSDVFKSHGKIRPTIVFHEGLNVCKGPNDSTNSIGKSTFLMVIDFVFGGSDYVDKLEDIIRHVKDHDIQFAFEFENVTYYFSRSTANKDIVTICNKNYEKTDESITLSNYTSWLKEKYQIKNNLTFRSIVNRYFRVYGRENGNETLPLRSANNEPSSKAIISLLQLFELYDVIEKDIDEEKLLENKKTAFSKAQEYAYIPKINKTQYSANLKKIDELTKRKLELAKSTNNNLLELDSEKAEIISNLKSELTIFKRQRGKYYSQLDSIKKNKEIKSSSIQNNFNDLEEFFPNASINIEKLQAIENFHKGITSILKANFAESEQKIWNLINLISMQIKNIEEKIESISQTNNLSKLVLEKYAHLDQEINTLIDQNNKYILSQELTKAHKEKLSALEESQKKQEEQLESKINNKMKELNAYIFNRDINSPILKFESAKTYTFYTFDDHGTGTNYKGLIIFDLACLLLTELPCIIHDSFLFKNISKLTIKKIIELYNNINEKQIFISIDNTDNYYSDTQEIINNKYVLELSGADNALYGEKW